jgi:hypothetical protein
MVRTPTANRFFVPFLLFLSVLGVYLSTAERQGVNVDAYAASAAAWRLGTTGTPYFDGLALEKIHGTHLTERNGQWIGESPNGHVNAQRMLGPVVVGAPFYAVLSAGQTSEADFTLAPAALAASLLTALAVLLVYLTVERLWRPGPALFTALVFAFATPTWTISANGLWTHTLTQVGIAGAAYASSRSRWWLAGFFLAFAMLGRPHLAVVAAVLGVVVAWRGRDWTVLPRVGVPTGGSLAVIATWNRYVHGEWSIGGSYGDAVNRAAEGLGAELGRSQLLNYLGFLFSLNRGMLVWTPVLLLFVAAAVRRRREMPAWVWALALGGAVYTFFQLRLNHFSGGTFFYSYRHGLELLTSLVPLLALAAPGLGRVARALLPPLVALQFGALAVGAAEEGLFVPPEHEWFDNGLLVAVRMEPVLIGGWLGLCVAIGVLVSVRYMPYPSRARASTVATTPDGRPPQEQPRVGS